LHIQKALEVTNFASTFKGKTTHLPLSVSERDVERSLLAACPFFATESWTSASPFEIPVSPSHFDLIVLLSGRGVLRSTDFAFPVEQGECWLLPANLQDCHFVPIEATQMIRTYVPDIGVLREELQRGSRPASVDNTVFD
jgi:mannose-6-phosphate isomerase class I